MATGPENCDERFAMSQGPPGHKLVHCWSLAEHSIVKMLTYLGPAGLHVPLAAVRLLPAGQILANFKCAPASSLPRGPCRGKDSMVACFTDRKLRVIRQCRVATAERAEVEHGGRKVTGPSSDSAGRHAYLQDLELRPHCAAAGEAQKARMPADRFSGMQIF